MNRKIKKADESIFIVDGKEKFYSELPEKMKAFVFSKFKAQLLGICEGACEGCQFNTGVEYEHVPDILRPDEPNDCKILKAFRPAVLQEKEDEYAEEWRRERKQRIFEHEQKLKRFINKYMKGKKK